MMLCEKRSTENLRVMIKIGGSRNKRAGLIEGPSMLSGRLSDVSGSLQK